MNRIIKSLECHVPALYMSPQETQFEVIQQDYTITGFYHVSRIGFYRNKRFLSPNLDSQDSEVFVTRK